MNKVTCTTVQEAIKANSCSLAMIAIQKKEVAVDILTILIGQSILYFNVGKTMGTAQIGIVIDMLLSDPMTKNLKPEDYKVLFEDMKKGYYGNLYDRFDGQIIFQNAIKYADKKQSIIEIDSISQHECRIKNSFISPELIPILKQIGNEIPKEKKIDQNSGKPRYQSDKDKFVQECFNEFEKIYDLKPVRTQTSMRFISYNNKKVGQVEFIEMKLKEKYPDETKNITP